MNHVNRTRLLDAESIWLSWHDADTAAAFERTKVKVRPNGKTVRKTIFVPANCSALWPDEPKADTLKAPFDEP